MLYRVDQLDKKEVTKDDSETRTNIFAKTKSERHEKVEEFFLVNDSATVAVEVPVYLTKEESEFPKALADHIDVIQVRNNKVHILDYKPEREGNAVNQLQLYAKCLKKRTGISNITCAYFDETDYSQFTLNH